MPARSQAYNIWYRITPATTRFPETQRDDMVRETTYSGARRNLAALMDQVTDTHEPVWIRRRGKEAVALISAEDLSSLMETDYLLRSPRNAERLLEAKAEP